MIHTRVVFTPAVLCACALTLASCASAPGRRVIHPPTPPASDPAFDSLPASAEPGFTFAVGDELEVKFPYRTDFNERATVRTDGKITLPLVGSVQAEGLSPEAL